MLYLLGAGDFLFCWRYRGTLEEGGIGPGGGDVVEGHQRKVASLRAGTPSGDTTRAP